MTTHRDRHLRSARKSRGQSLVEFAFVLPIFLLMLFGLIDVGRLVYMNSVLSQAAREGARLAAVEAYWIGSADPGCGTGGGPVCPATPAAMRADAAVAASRMAAPFGTITTTQVFMRCDDPGGAPTGAWTGATCDSAKRVPNHSLVSVRVVLTFQPITPIVSGIVGSITTSGSATMVIN